VGHQCLCCNCAEPGHRKHRDYVLPVVLKAQAGIVTAPHTKGTEVPGRAPDERRQFTIGDGSIVVDDGSSGGLRPPVPEISSR
jgi:hypothetical protein